MGTKCELCWVKPLKLKSIAALPSQKRLTRRPVRHSPYSSVTKRSTLTEVTSHSPARACTAQGLRGSRRFWWAFREVGRVGRGVGGGAPLQRSVVRLANLNTGRRSHTRPSTWLFFSPSHFANALIKSTLALEHGQRHPAEQPAQQLAFTGTTPMNATSRPESALLFILALGLCLF